MACVKTGSPEDSMRAMGIFLVRRRAEAAEKGTPKSFPTLRQEWFALSPEQQAAFEEEARSLRRTTAADAKEVLKRQEEASMLRKPTPVKAQEGSKKRSREKVEAMPTPQFPVRQDSRRGSGEAGEKWSGTSKAAARRPETARGPSDLKSAAAKLLSPRFSFDWADDLEAELHVAPAEDQDLRKLLREELQRSISEKEALRAQA
ncbi:unnamed protein product [Durusdinium trenchii]|uniref:HMG box domain-containing protein n=1 Tax=Durusdinium trenchii TaxID=1381693 RepID=A0ABP0RRC2_9DINO